MAITTTTSFPREAVIGNLRIVMTNIIVGTTADTLSFPSVDRILAVSMTPNTSITRVAATNRSGSTAAYLTFTGTTAGVTEFVTVIGQ